MSWFVTLFALVAFWSVRTLADLREFKRRAPEAHRQAYRETRANFWRIIIASYAVALIITALAAL